MYVGLVSLIRSNMMSAESDWLLAMASGVAILISISAAFITIRTTPGSQLSVEVLEEALHRSAMYKLIAECHALIIEELQIRLLALELHSEYASLNALSGLMGSSRGKLQQNLIENSLNTASEQTTEAKLLLKDQAKLITAVDKYELDLMQARIESAKENLQAVREAMSHQLGKVRCQNQLYREKGAA